MREAFARAADVKLTPAELRVLGAVFALVSSYSKTSDELYVEQIAQTANLAYRTTQQALKRLNELGILHYNGRRGPGKRPLVELPTPSLTGPLCSGQAPDDSDPVKEPLTGPKPAPSPDHSDPGTEKTFREEDVVVDTTHELIELEQALDELGFTPKQKLRALNENPAYVIAWIARAQSDGIDNPTAYAWAGIISGEWPTLRPVEVRGTHGTTKVISEPSTGPWQVEAFDINTGTFRVVGVYDDRDEARAVYEQHEANGGATMRPVEKFAA